MLKQDLLAFRKHTVRGETQDMKTKQLYDSRIAVKGTVVVGGKEGSGL